jgi:hypothetical protein
MPCDSHGMSQKLARPKRFELLTPRFVVWSCGLLISPDNWPMPYSASNSRRRSTCKRCTSSQHNAACIVGLLQPRIKDLSPITVATVARGAAKPLILLAGGPERTRTSDLRFRKPLLYPAELRDLAYFQSVSDSAVFRYSIFPPNSHRAVRVWPFLTSTEAMRPLAAPRPSACLEYRPHRR